jgi:hypothetical protein
MNSILTKFSAVLLTCGALAAVGSESSLSYPSAQSKNDYIDSYGVIDKDETLATHGCERFPDSDRENPESCPVIAAAVGAYLGTKVADHYWNKYGEQALNDLDAWAGEKYAQAKEAYKESKHGRGVSIDPITPDFSQFDIVE